LTWVEPVEFKGFGVCEENVLAAALIQASDNIFFFFYDLIF